MSQPASRVIGIIRISEPSEFDVGLSVGADDSTLAALLASLVGKQAADLVRQRRSRWEPAQIPRERCSPRLVMRANLARLREELEREYLAVAAS